MAFASSVSLRAAAVAAAGGGATQRSLLYLSSCSLLSSLLRPRPPRVYPRFNRTFCSASTTAADPEAALQPLRHSILLERLRTRHLKGGAKAPSSSPPRHPAAPAAEKAKKAASFSELGLSEEVMGAVREMGITVPTEIQCIGVPAVLEGKSVVLGSHTGSGKTLAYMLPLVQLLRRDEEMSGMQMKPRRPRAVVLCPTRELCEQVFRVSKSVSHHARFRSTMISGGGRIRPQEDSLNVPVDVVVGTPGRILQHIEEGNFVYGDIKYLVLDEADTMFDRGFGPDIRKFLAPLKNRAEKPGDQGFQTVLVTATMTKFWVSKSVSHHALFRSTMISGGGWIRPQENSLNVLVDMVVRTPGRILQHIEEGNFVYGDFKYVVLDEADTMFDLRFGPDIRKFLAPLKNRAEKPGDQGFQTVLVTATMTKAVQKLIDEEFEGIIHLRTSTLHKKVASARHDFIKLSGAENKLESLLQYNSSLMGRGLVDDGEVIIAVRPGNIQSCALPVLEPSLAKGNRVMVFCNTLNSSRAVDHFLGENHIFTVNYHGEVPAEERVENLKKFKSEEGDCPTLVCTDLAARGLDLDVDHVIMFDFPSNPIDYLHRTGRTARMGAKGKVTSLVAKKNLILAARIEEAMRKNESLEALTSDSIERNYPKSRKIDQKGKNSSSDKTTSQRTRQTPNSSTSRTPTSTSRKVGKITVRSSSRKPVAAKTGKFSTPTKAKKAPISKQAKVTTGGLRKESSKGGKNPGSRKFDSSRVASKLSVVGFRGRSSGKRGPLKSS